MLFTSLVCAWIFLVGLIAAKNVSLSQMKGMQKRTKSNHYMELNSAELKSIIDTPNRSYHLFVLFSTTDPAAKCGLCP
jgi:hypothetical protein